MDNISVVDGTYIPWSLVYFIYLGNGSGGDPGVWLRLLSWKIERRGFVHRAMISPVEMEQPHSIIQLLFFAYILIYRSFSRLFVQTIVFATFVCAS